MKLYIANTTKQNLDFTYRMEGQNGIRLQKIGIGQQVPISDTRDGGMTQREIDYIVRQHERYGLVNVKDIDRTKAFIGICYSVDKPILVEDIMVAMDHNQDVLIKRGQEQRQMLAVASNNVIDNHLQDMQSQAQINELEITVEQDSKTGDPAEDPLREGVIVSKSAPDKPVISDRPQRSRAASARR